MPPVVLVSTLLLCQELIVNDQARGQAGLRARTEMAARLLSLRLRSDQAELNRLARQLDRADPDVKKYREEIIDAMSDHAEWQAVRWNDPRSNRSLSLGPTATNSSDTLQLTDLTGRLTVDFNCVAALTEVQTEMGAQDGLLFDRGAFRSSVQSKHSLADPSWSAKAKLGVPYTDWHIYLTPTSAEVRSYVSETPGQLLVSGVLLTLVLLGLIYSNSNASQRHLALAADNEKLLNLATRDGLTGVFNRRYFDEVLAAEVDRCNRYGNQVSLILLDVDLFKSYNDDWGHVAGDTVLAEVARRITQGSRTTDMVARYGGEEFAVILPETDVTSARIYAERIRRTIEADGWPNRQITASIGIAGLRRGESGRNMVEEADQALYLAKTSGRNNVKSAMDLESASWTPAA